MAFKEISAITFRNLKKTKKLILKEAACVGDKSYNPEKDIIHLNHIGMKMTLIQDDKQLKYLKLLV